MKPRIDLIAANVLAALCLFATIAFAAEPPTEPPAPLLFGLPAQDWICQDGTCQLRPTRQVIRQKTTSRPVFGLPAVNRTRTVQRVTPAVVAQAPVITSVAPVKTTVQVPVTEWIDEEYQVPVTRMETRVRKKQVTRYETQEQWVCPQPTNYVVPVQTNYVVPVQTNYVVPVQTYFCPASTYSPAPLQVQVKQTKIQRSGGPLRRMGQLIVQPFRNVRAKRSGNVSAGTVYPPAGQDVYSHLIHDHGMSASYVYSLSYSQALQAHTARH
jgi:hypothetical protein